jgi:hypothetical protein
MNEAAEARTSVQVLTEFEFINFLRELGGRELAKPSR